MCAGVNTASRTPSAQAAALGSPCTAQQGQTAHFSRPRHAALVHKGKSKKEAVQGYRFPTRDYRQPAFYMITMSACDRHPRFATCANNRAILTEDGRLVYALWHRMARDYPQISLSTLIIMPDHLHGIVRITERMDKPIGVPLRAFKSQVTSALRKRYDDPALNIWAPGYHDWAVWRRGSLNAYIQYIRDNPRRYCLKKAHPDLFSRVNNLKHYRLPESENWSGYGNLFLLDKPELRPLRVSRSVSAQNLETLRSEAVDSAKRGVVTVSPFISPGEKDVAKSVLAAGGSVILLKPEGFDRYFKPHGKYFDLCLDGRLLILACRPPVTSAAPLTRELCLAMNQWCTAIASTQN